MTILSERASQLANILQDPKTKQIRKTLVEGHDLEIGISPEYDASIDLEYIKITIYNNREKNYWKKVKESSQFTITFYKLLALHENGDLPDYLYNLAMERVVETPSETALKFMEILNKKQTK